MLLLSQMTQQTEAEIHSLGIFYFHMTFEDMLDIISMYVEDRGTFSIFFFLQLYEKSLLALQAHDSFFSHWKKCLLIMKHTGNYSPNWHRKSDSRQTELRCWVEWDIELERRCYGTLGRLLHPCLVLLISVNPHGWVHADPAWPSFPVQVPWGKE